MYLKRLFKTVVLKGFPLEKGGERRKRKINWNLKAWNSLTKHRCPGLEVHEVFAVAGADTLCRVTVTVDSRFPDSQSLDLWPRRACRDVAGTLEVDVLYFSILKLLILLCVKRQQVNKHCHQHCYWELEELGSCPDPQCKLTTLHPKWTYVLCLLIAESSPGPCDDLPSASPFSLQTWYLGFCPWWFLPPYYWRRHHSSGPLWPKKHSAIMMWPLPPLLFFSAQIQHSPL